MLHASIAGPNLASRRVYMSKFLQIISAFLVQFVIEKPAQKRPSWLSDSDKREIFGASQGHQIAVPLASASKKYALQPAQMGICGPDMHRTQTFPVQHTPPQSVALMIGQTNQRPSYHSNQTRYDASSKPSNSKQRAVPGGSARVHSDRSSLPSLHPQERLDGGNSLDQILGTVLKRSYKRQFP